MLLKFHRFREGYQGGASKAGILRLYDPHLPIGKEFFNRLMEGIPEAGEEPIL